MNEMKDHRIDMQTDIDHLKKVVFNADMHGSLFNKPQHGHDNEAKNEERVQHDGADNDAGNDISNSKLDVGDNANNSNKPVLDKYSLNDDFDAEGYAFVNDDIDDDGNVCNNNEGHSVNDVDKTVNALRVSFGATNFSNGNDSDKNLFSIDLDAHRIVSLSLIHI